MLIPGVQGLCAAQTGFFIWFSIRGLLNLAIFDYYINVIYRVAPINRLILDDQLIGFWNFGRFM
jgi:hypothetical protein